MKIVCVGLAGLVCLLLVYAATFAEREKQLVAQNQTLAEAVNLLSSDHMMMASNVNAMVEFHNLSIATIQSNLDSGRPLTWNLPRQPELSQVNENVDRLNQMLGEFQHQ